MHISYEGHHKHSYYLIKNGDLRGFEPDEIETMALVARYHRRATPKRRHEGLRRAAAQARAETIRMLSAAILRLAESLDRSHAQTIPSSSTIAATTTCCRSAAAGRRRARALVGARHAAPFEKVIGKPLRVEAPADTYVEQPDQPHEYPGKLFVVEGIDGSGKTTQLGLLAKWLSAEGHRVFVTEWNSSALVKAATKTGRRRTR